jgi:hypothetical protein
MQDNSEYIEWDVKPPETINHGSLDEVDNKRERVTTSNWHQEGNLLICDTQFGRLTNYIPTNKLFRGDLDKNGYPILTDITYE